MLTVDLNRLFLQLPYPRPIDDDPSQLWALPVPEFSRHRIAKGASGMPILLLSASDPNDRMYSAPVQLENLSVQYDLECRLIDPLGRAELGIFTVISCTAEPTLRGQFLSVASLVVEAVGANPNRANIQNTVEGLVELFRALARPARKTVQGLWAELYIIQRSTNPESLARAWHALPEDRYDFATDSQRIEVKATSTRVRAHHFSLDQLRPIEGATVLVASLLVERLGDGVTLGTLLTGVRALLSHVPEVAMHVEAVVAATLGQSLRRSLDDAFDAALAEQSLRLFQSNNIPRILGTIPSAISDVRFRVDLSATEHTEIDASFTGLFGGLHRRSIVL